jgi:TctA family transporter
MEAPENIVLVLAGCFVGRFIGMMPGRGPITAVTLMISMTDALDPAINSFTRTFLTAAPWCLFSHNKMVY